MMGIVLIDLMRQRISTWRADAYGDVSLFDYWGMDGSSLAFMQANLESGWSGVGVVVRDQWQRFADSNTNLEASFGRILKHYMTKV